MKKRWIRHCERGILHRRKDLSVWHWGHLSLLEKRKDRRLWEWHSVLAVVQLHHLSVITIVHALEIGLVMLAISVDLKWASSIVMPSPFVFHFKSPPWLFLSRPFSLMIGLFFKASPSPWTPFPLLHYHIRPNVLLVIGFLTRVTTVLLDLLINRTFLLNTPDIFLSQRLTPLGIVHRNADSPSPIDRFLLHLLRQADRIVRMVDLPENVNHKAYAFFLLIEEPIVQID